MVSGYSLLFVMLVAVSGTWSVVNTTGAVVKGGYGHSSVCDELTGVILVHGGYHSMSAATYLLTDALYEFNPNTSAWYTHCHFAHLHHVISQSINMSICIAPNRQKSSEVLAAKQMRFELFFANVSMESNEVCSSTRSLFRVTGLDTAKLRRPMVVLVVLGLYAVL